MDQVIEKLQNADTIMEVTDLCKFFKAGRKQTLKAVDHVSVSIKRGETLGLVGESGCGKTTCGRTMMKLYEPTSGKVVFDGKDISTLKGKDLLEFRKNVQIIFQDPYASLDPRMTIGEIISEGMDVHFKLTDKEKNDKVAELLNKVGLSADYANRFAHELSGGQRQRVGIARALAVVHRLRRANLRTRRFHSGTGCQPAHQAPERVWSDLSVHLARPVDGQAHFRPCRRYVPRFDGRACQQPRPVRQTAASIHPGADFGNPDSRPGCGSNPSAYQARGRGAKPNQPATGLQIQSKMPLCNGHLCYPVPCAAGGRTKSFCSLPPLQQK